MALEGKFAGLQALPLFRGIDEASFTALMRGAYLQAFPPQVELIREGDASDFLHVLVDGMAELFASWNGRETLMQLVHPVSTFILAATIRDAPYLMSARTLERSRIVLIPSQDVRAVFAADPAFARAVVADLAHCDRDVVRHAKDVKLRNALERLANYLLRMRRATGDAAAFELPIEKRRLAAFLAMTPENLSRAFRTLEAYGVVVDGGTVRIVDPADLALLAKPTPLIDDTTL